MTKKNKEAVEVLEVYQELVARIEEVIKGARVDLVLMGLRDIETRVMLELIRSQFEEYHGKKD